MTEREKEITIQTVVYCAFYPSDFTKAIESYNKDVDPEDRIEDVEAHVKHLISAADGDMLAEFVEIHEPNVEGEEFIEWLLETEPLP